MRVFDHPNMTNFECPICKGKEDKPVVLVGIDGTEDGNIIEAVQVHLDCLELRLSKSNQAEIIYQIIG